MSIPTHQVRVIVCKQGAVRAVRFNVDGNYCMTCGSDKSLKLWNPYRGVLLQTYSGHGYEVLDAQGSCDSSHITSGGMDKMVFLWDVTTARPVRKYRGHAAQVNAVKFNEESTVILSGSLDGTVRVWDCRSRTKDPVQILDESKDSITSLQVSNYEILTGSLDSRIRRYDLRKGELYCDCVGSSATCVSFTKDGQCILVSCLDSTLKLMDKDTGEMLSEYTGHKNTEYRIDSCLNDDDRRVVSGSEDGAVYFWNLVEGSLLKSLQHPGHKVVHSLSFHPKDATMLSASEGSIYLWKDNLLNEDDADTSGS